MSTAERLHPSAGTAVLRRYRTQSEDAACWLLAIAAGEQPRYCVLDDRALFAAGPAEGSRLAPHLLAATGGRIDLLGATGLGAPERAREALDGLEVVELWLPWTEDPADPAARRLRRDHAAGAATLRRAADRLDEVATGPAAPGGAPSAEQLRRVAATLPAGEPCGAPLLAGLAGRVRYRRAGDASDDVLLPGLRLRVLAPSGDDPRLAAAGTVAAGDATHSGPAMAEPAPRFSPGASLFAAALTDPIGLPLAPEDRALQQLDRPFDRIYALPYEAAAADPHWGDFFRAHYGFADGQPDGPAWRRIDADWLGTAARFAAQLDAERAAVTLALEVELGSPARALLFPPQADTPPPSGHLSLSPLAEEASWTDQVFPLA